MKGNKSSDILVMFLVLPLICFHACAREKTVSAPQLGTNPINEVIGAMTLREKAMVLVGAGADPQRIPGAVGITHEIPRLGIPSIVLADAHSGLRINPTREDDPETYHSTDFPIATQLASTWDLDLVYAVGKAIGNEGLEYGVDVLLAPGLNIHRNPLGGRNMEYFSEDPLVSGKMAGAMVSAIQSEGVGTSIKHFVAYNQKTTSNVIVSERALREIYMKGFRLAVEDAAPWAVMSTYNRLNGPYTSENSELFTKVLRDDWGFQGYVMTDWDSGKDVVAQMNAGNDLLMAGSSEQLESIVNAVKEGNLEESVLDRNAKRILNKLLQTLSFRGFDYSNKPNLEEHARLARQVATEGMLLLTNHNGALPIAGDIQTIAAFGKTSYEVITAGVSSPEITHHTTYIRLAEGLQNGGYTVHKSLQEEYLSYIAEMRVKEPTQRFSFMPEMHISDQRARQMADEADIALITIGRNSGMENRAENSEFNLADAEQWLIRTVSEAFHEEGKIAIVVLNISSVIETSSWKDIPDAILLAWQPRQEVGNSIVDVISGKANPSGKLATTFPISYQDEPSAKNFLEIEPETTHSKEVEEDAALKELVYEEDIYVGYRYFNTFDIPVAYEFGYGLSYTEFEYGNTQASSKKFGDTFTISVDIVNTGDVAGREVVQVYLSAPEGNNDKPKEELVAFRKTKSLEAGETETLGFTINKIDLTSFDEATAAWVADAGNYTVKIGASSRDIRETVSFTLDHELIVRQVNKALAPGREIDTIER